MCGSAAGAVARTHPRLVLTLVSSFSLASPRAGVVRAVLTMDVGEVEGRAEEVEARIRSVTKTPQLLGALICKDVVLPSSPPS